MGIFTTRGTFAKLKARPYLLTNRYLDLSFHRLLTRFRHTRENRHIRSPADYVLLSDEWVYLHHAARPLSQWPAVKFSARMPFWD
jgi:hypothetical protein